MNTLKKLLGLTFLCVTYSSYGQVNCTDHSIIGTWRQVQSIHGVHTNVDSLKEIMTKSGKTIGTLEFKADRTYKYSFLDANNRKYRQYSIDTLTCEIILGTKKKARTNSNLKVIYLDDQFFIFSEDNNPKGVVTHLTTKLEGPK